MGLSYRKCPISVTIGEIKCMYVLLEIVLRECQKTHKTHKVHQMHRFCPRFCLMGILCSFHDPVFMSRIHQCCTGNANFCTSRCLTPPTSTLLWPRPSTHIIKQKNFCATHHLSPLTLQLKCHTHQVTAILPKSSASMICSQYAHLHQLQESNSPRFLSRNIKAG